MSELSLFERELEALIGRGTGLRPFVCSGSPLDCGIFIVGFNPATEMRGDFWDHWRAGYGFDKEAWFRAYLDERRDRPLKSGKKRRAEVSNTRRVIEWIIEAAKPVRCLETNLYSAATERAIDLIGEQRRMAPFEFLMKTIKPRMVVAHGRDANIAMREWCIDGHAQVISLPHFSRGWSKEKARLLGGHLRSDYERMGNTR